MWYETFLGDYIAQTLPEKTQLATSHQPPTTSHLSLLWLEGRCQEMGMAARYWPIIDVLHSYLGWQFDDDEAARAGLVVHALDHLVADGHLTDEQREEIGPLLGNLLSLHFGMEWDERLRFADPEQLRHRTLMGLCDLFVAIARQQPVVLVFEDLHWADALTLDLIALLMETLTDAALLLLCIYRPEREHRCWQLTTQARQKCAGCFAELRLHELTPAQSRQMISSLLAIDNLPDNVRETILRKSGGNPLFVEEVVRSFIDAGVVYRDDDTWRASQTIVDIIVPETVQSVVLARLDRLAAELKEVLQRAAVIGRLFGKRLMARLLPPSLDLATAVATLADHDFIYQERAVPEVEYSFKHVLVREAVYQTTLQEQRARYHRQVAEAMEELYGDHIEEIVEQLAHHYDRSGVIEKAMTYLLRAGEKTRRVYLNEEAIRYYQRVQELLDSQEPGSASTNNEVWQEWRLEALHRLGQVHVGTGKLAEGEGYLRQAIALGRKTGILLPKLIRLYYELGEVLFWLTRYDERIKLGEEGLALLSEDEESVEAVIMTGLIAWGQYIKENKENREIARKLTMRNAKILPHLPYSEELASAYIHVVIAYVDFENNIEEAMKWAQALQAKAEKHHDLRALGHVYRHMGDVIFPSRGDLQQAIVHTQRGLELFTQIGDVKHECDSLTNLGSFFLQLGDLEKAEVYLLSALGKVEAILTKTGIDFDFGVIFLCRQEWEKALESFQKLIQLAQGASDPASETWYIYCLGRVYLAQGNRKEALRQFQVLFARLASPSAEPHIPIKDYVPLLGALDEAYQDEEALHAFCQQFRDDVFDFTGNTFVQWYLEPCTSDPRFETMDFGFDHTNFNRLQAQIQRGDWRWQDPFNDCSYTIQDQLEIRATNARGLRYLNRSAPRLLSQVCRDFAMETVCSESLVERPAIGGLLLWKDEENYLCLTKGFRKHESSFFGLLANEDLQFGRGRLSSERVFLRLERLGQRINALCSADGEQWYTVGHVDFLPEDPLQIGLHAIGTIDRLVYPGAYPDGTAIRFESFRLLRRA